MKVSKNSNELRGPFHWPLEFPEVFVSGGFDAIIGNPPFMGGRRMRGSLGDSMMEWFSFSWPHASLNADLSSFFYLRAANLLTTGGEFGLLATQTIGKGDTARTGLSHLIQKEKITIRNALSSFTWPGKASVTAALVIGHKGIWRGIKYLDNSKVDKISPALDKLEGWGKAKALKMNKDKSFQGSVLRGKGFILSDEEARTFLQERSISSQVISPFMSGEDLNSSPQQKTIRWTINFKDMEFDECENNWPELMERVRELVNLKGKKQQKSKQIEKTGGNTGEYEISFMIK
ncbi:Eco57I restriction-modification methylase domain-containing protein [Geomicrobium sp. JCM 19039]|uniref:Eco57I restriction-modification methylase domain-containing protein n=1 Tax=Geomicrobium sp. JCM 19039 TaxID=1460636 RepID=UPI0005A71E83|nr:DNA methyltransferase [Geomicrobium sp. JCM 19039]